MAETGETTAAAVAVVVAFLMNSLLSIVVYFDLWICVVII